MASGWLLAIIGIAIIAIALYDFTRTTLTIAKAGPISTRLASMIWSAFLSYHRHRPSHRILAAAGPMITILSLMFWFIANWLGWFLLYCSTDQAVLNSTTHQSATIVERAYFVGYTITTLGYGDFAPGTDIWRLLAPVASLNGFFLLTLAVTYIMPILSAATEKRQLALSINAIATTPSAIIDATVDNGNFQSLTTQLQQIQTTVVGNCQKHLTYPILHYFHSHTAEDALPLALVRLYEALAIICFAYPDLSPTSYSQLQIMQRSLDQFLMTLHDNNFLSPRKNMPAIPDAAPSSKPPHADKSFPEIRDYLASLDQQKLLYAYVKKDGWQWHDVWQEKNG